jgi:hypothetical protein
MDIDLKKCKQCNRLFSPDEDTTICQKCSEVKDRDYDLVEDAITVYHITTPSEIVAHTHLPLERVKEILKTSKVLAQEVDSETRCVQCKKRPATADSDICLACQLAMFKSLNDISSTLRATLPAANAREKVSLRDTMEEKRSRSGFKKFNPATKSIKGTGG